MKALITILATVMMVNTCNGRGNSPLSGDKQFADLAAVIVPHAGYYFSGNVAAAAYMAVPTGKEYKRIFLLGLNLQPLE